MTRLLKIAISLSIGFLMGLVAFDNIVDYGVNFDAVQHIMSMDMVPEDRLKWRAITMPALQHFFFVLIIAAEAASAALSLYGAFVLWLARSGGGRAFDVAKGAALAGIGVGFLLYLFGFMVVGGEWFQMWRAGAYNLQEPAFRFIGVLGLSLIFIALPEPDQG